MCFGDVIKIFNLFLIFFWQLWRHIKPDWAHTLVKSINFRIPLPDNLLELWLASFGCFDPIGEFNSNTRNNLLVIGQRNSVQGLSRSNVQLGFKSLVFTFFELYDVIGDFRWRNNLRKSEYDHSLRHNCLKSDHKVK